ncbi:hypothetical protein QO011_005088 [Labrys wisconsinensis]|uniref:Uncharacterized protein n=1 Tax=Labrys wisconsinensis TaxID=425677 RepID=A0ABU0JCQ3_9HYPH|nr:hypothetical protein [Labrys wisconsinensis]
MRPEKRPDGGQVDLSDAGGVVLAAAGPDLSSVHKWSRVLCALTLAVPVKDPSRFGAA